jgi:hypothetical protein
MLSTNESPFFGLSFAEILVAADKLYGRGYLTGFLELAMPQLQMHRQELARVAQQLRQGGEGELATIIKGHQATALRGDWEPQEPKRPKGNCSKNDARDSPAEPKKEQ